MKSKLKLRNAKGNQVREHIDKCPICSKDIFTASLRSVHFCIEEILYCLLVVSDKRWEGIHQNYHIFCASET